MSGRTAVRNAHRGFRAAVSFLALAFIASIRQETGTVAAPGEQADIPVSMPIPAPIEQHFTILACGDILLSRTPGKRAAEHGFRYLFAGIRDLVSEADIAFANLENPVSYLGTPYPGKPPNVTFRADPATLFGLAWAGFDVLSLANNHMNDYGAHAVGETLDFLDLLGIARSGAGRDLEEARSPAILERDGVRFAFLSYAEPVYSVTAARSVRESRSQDSEDTMLDGPLQPAAVKGQPAETTGVALAAMEDVIADIRSVRESLEPDYLFVSVHWGDEHQHIPNAFQRALGRAVIDAGATAVLGHHPHVLQSLEHYGDGFIVYSLGNLVFDMASDQTYETMAIRLHLSNGRLTHADIIPLSIARGSYAPELASPQAAEKRLADIARWSPGLGGALLIEGSAASLFF
jgi:poly-gamma-glutamate synthesis protein (capsule biosynthesis protein)